MADLFHTQIHKTQHGLPRLQFHFRKAAYEKLCSTRLGKTILFTDHGDDWSDEEIVLGYRAQHHVEGDFRHFKNPLYLSFRPTFHWTDQKLRVHAFYCVLALIDSQSAAPATGSGRHPGQRGENDEAAHRYSGSNHALSGSATRPRTHGPNRAVDDECPPAKDDYHARPRALSQRLGHAFPTLSHPRQQRLCTRFLL
jgi:hypothetical protein